MAAVFEKILDKLKNGWYNKQENKAEHPVLTHAPDLCSIGQY